MFHPHPVYHSKLQEQIYKLLAEKRQLIHSMDLEEVSGGSSWLNSLSSAEDHSDWESLVLLIR